MTALGIGSIQIYIFCRSDQYLPISRLFSAQPQSEIKIFRKLDLGNLSVGNNGDEAVAAVVDGRW